MSQPYLGQIVLVGFSFPPLGWALCNGQLLPIAEYSALFALLGTTFGGDGQNTFALPDLRGRVIVGTGQGSAGPTYNQGMAAGAENITLTAAQDGAHTHTLMGGGVGTTGTPGPSVALGTVPAGTNVYATAGATAPLASNAVAPAGGGQPHENRQPFTTLNYIIALQGIFPSQN